MGDFLGRAPGISTDRRDEEEARLGRGTLGLSAVLAEAAPVPQNWRALLPSQARSLVTQCLGRQFLERLHCPRGSLKLTCCVVRPWPATVARAVACAACREEAWSWVRRSLRREQAAWRAALLSPGAPSFCAWGAAALCSGALRPSSCPSRDLPQLSHCAPPALPWHRPGVLSSLEISVSCSPSAWDWSRLFRAVLSPAAGWKRGLRLPAWGAA